MKLRHLLLSAAALVVMTIGGATVAYADDVSKAPEIPSKTVSSIDDVKSDDWTGESYIKEGSTDTYYKLTLTKPSKVNMKFASDNGVSGDIDVYKSQSSVFTNDGKFIDGYISYTQNATLALEPGTYYFKINTNVKSSIEDNSKRMYMGVFVENFKRTGTKDGTKMANAIPLNNGNYGTFTSYGAITSGARKQAFKLDVKSKSDVTLKALETNLVYSPDAYLSKRFVMNIYNSEGELVQGFGDDNNRKNTGSITLDRGIYYVVIIPYYTSYATSFDSEYINAQISMSATVKDVYAPAKPSVVNYKSGSKTISGKAEAGSTVYVKVGKKTYKTTANNLGTYKVVVPTLKVGTKVYAYAVDNSKNKSSVTTKTVANRRFPSARVNRIRRNARRITGTARKNTTVYVRYNGKTYKAKVSARGTFAVRTPALRRGRTLSVKVMDAYGNYSAIRRITIR